MGTLGLMILMWGLGCAAGYLFGMDKAYKQLIPEKAVTGALKQTIHVHGPITPQHIGSAAKRIMGALKH